MKNLITRILDYIFGDFELGAKKFFMDEKLREFPPQSLTHKQLKWINDKKHLNQLREYTKDW